ncbi:unnamed protein product [Lactuca saligna]|uniref:Uncharacterized protein n=1 Tax=Lactuca saligna TaxID=75948 RepID=A0AA35ZVS4_LACSI|nr:unnamed protein product [Lactuca saligna]
MIGVVVVAQLFSSVYFSAWSNRSYFRPLIFSNIVPFMGNVMLGSARAVNRRFPMAFTTTMLSRGMLGIVGFTKKDLGNAKTTIYWVTGYERYASSGHHLCSGVGLDKPNGWGFDTTQVDNILKNLKVRMMKKKQAYQRTIVKKLHVPKEGHFLAQKKI